jgi:ribosomal protein S18 acetylase RimI-like enzyme
VEYRDANEADDEQLIAQYLAVWRSYGVAEASFALDAGEIARAFIRRSRMDCEGGAVVAIEDMQMVGSVAYQVHAPLFPEVLRPEVRKIGYIWSVYVNPKWRGQGLASHMVTWRWTAFARSTAATPCCTHRTLGRRFMSAWASLTPKR